MRKTNPKKKKNNNDLLKKKKISNETNEEIKTEKLKNNVSKKKEKTKKKLKLNIFKKKTNDTPQKVVSKSNVKEIKNKANTKNIVKSNKSNNITNKNTTIKTSKGTKNNNTSKNVPTRTKRKRSFWKKLLTAILTMGILFVLSIATFFIYIILSAPEFDEEAFKVKDQSLVYDINGEIIAKLGTQNRESVTYDDLPQVLIDAIIATEDSRYFQHNGVDLPRFLKASLYQVLGKSGAGGASTLTMQMVKNNLTSTEDEGIKGIIRKFQDIYLAVFKVEKNYTKEEIIELYVNNHNLGSSTYGVGEAAKYYFGKSVSELTLPEAALIAGLFQAPNGHNPYRHIESATARRNTVLKLMVRHGYITQEEADLANSVDIATQLVGETKKTEYQAYIDYVVDEVIKITGHDPTIVPMKVYTTMEKSIQNGINKIMNDKDAKYWKDDIVQAGIAIVNVKTGAVAALSGQRNNNDAKIWNYATDSLRQPGSTAKPIFAYGPSFEYLNESTYGFYVDEPWSYTNGKQVNNWDDQFMGIMTTRRAIEVSRNIPALKAFQKVGGKKIQQFAYSLGLDVSYSSKSENYRIVNEATGVDNTINEAYAIGGVAEGFSPLMMASAYSAFASGGYYTEEYSVTKIEYRETGEVIEHKPTKTRVMKDSTAYMINYTLESATKNGFNGGANVSGSRVAVKTGTTNYPDHVMKQLNMPSSAVNDLWTIAYTPDYSVAVWYGYDQLSSKYYNKLADKYKDQITSAVMKYIPKNSTGWKMPSSVVKVEVEKETYPAKLASEYTPDDMRTTECFVKGTQPTEVSDRYVKLSEISNTKLEVTSSSATITWEYTTPNSLTDEYIEAHFSQSIFNKSRNDLIEDRKKYNQKTLGNIVFGIYKETEEGLVLIEYTSETTYTYTAESPVTLVIKTEHDKYKKNGSDGIKITINYINDPTPNISPLNATLNGNISTTSTVGQYQEPGISTVTYNGEAIGMYYIKYKLIANLVETEYTGTNELVNAINQLPIGTYQIDYIISYNNEEITKHRYITLN